VRGRLLQVGPAGDLGGHMWGSASDGQYVYVANSNAGHRTAQLVNPVPSQPGQAANATINGGFAAKLVSGRASPTQRCRPVSASCRLLQCCVSSPCTSPVSSGGSSVGCDSEAGQW